MSGLIFRFGALLYPTIISRYTVVANYSIVCVSLPLQAGGIGCGVYTTNNAEACHYIADNSEANVVFAENKAQISKILEVSLCYYT